MSSFTRQAIMESFKKLVDEKPVSKISVKDIVEDCGVNRNTFYYHFEDIPSLVEAILIQEADTAFRQCKDIQSVEDCLKTVIRYASGKKKAVLHMYNSVSRDIYEKYLMQICAYAVETLIDSVVPEKKISEEFRKTLVRAYKCEMFGVTIDWLNHSMDEDYLKEYQLIFKLRAGEIERIAQGAQ